MEMDDETLEKIRNENEVDNSRLEELLNKFFELPDEGKQEFVNIFKESRLFMPIEIDAEAFDLENAKVGEVRKTTSPMGFSIKSITNENGTTVPLFTSEEVMRNADIRCSTYVLYMSDLAEMLKQSERYSSVTINPFTEHGLDIAIDTFLGLFEEPADAEKRLKKYLNEVLPIIKENSVEIKENTTLFFRHDENVMVENAVDGVFVPQMPFYVSSNPKYGEDLKYTNILLMPESKKIFPIGPDEDLDIIIAPGTEFKLEDVMDGTQNVWMCGAQPFYDD